MIGVRVQIGRTYFRLTVRPFFWELMTELSEPRMYGAGLWFERGWE